MAIQTLDQHTGGRNKAAPRLRQILIQTQFELLLTLRRSENILITLIVPVILHLLYIAEYCPGGQRSRRQLSSPGNTRAGGNGCGDGEPWYRNCL